MKKALPPGDPSLHGNCLGLSFLEEYEIGRREALSSYEVWRPKFQTYQDVRSLKTEKQITKALEVILFYKDMGPRLVWGRGDNEIREKRQTRIF